VPILFPVADVRHAVVIEILLGAFDAVMKSLPLNLTELVWRGVPVVMIMMVIVLRVCCSRRSRRRSIDWLVRSMSLGNNNARCA
jgi:hypothetical protein